MALISVLLSLLIERYLGIPEEFRRYTWFFKLTEGTRVLAPEVWRRPFLAVLLLLSAPLLIVVLFGKVLGAVWVGFAFLFGLTVLLYSYGPQDLNPRIEAFIDARLRGDEEAARWHLGCLLGGSAPEDGRRLTRTLMETVFVELNERLLGVIFWFVLLGPAGALAYRLSALLAARYPDPQDDFGDAAQKVHYWLAWIPSRVTAFSYAMVGSFVDATQFRRDEASTWDNVNRGTLAASGLGAAQYSDTDQSPSLEREIANLREALALVRRTKMLWVFVLAVLALFALVH